MNEEADIALQYFRESATEQLTGRQMNHLVKAISLKRVYTNEADVQREIDQLHFNFSNKLESLNRIIPKKEPIRLVRPRNPENRAVSSAAPRNSDISREEEGPLRIDEDDKGLKNYESFPSENKLQDGQEINIEVKNDNWSDFAVGVAA